MFKFLTSTSSSASVQLFTLMNGKKIGADPFGNVYYEGKPRKGYKLTRRWVLYNGEAEATRVPPEYHGWLHHQNNDFPSEQNELRRNWQKPYLPNQTGTINAYVPPGHVLRGANREKATGDYQAWMPAGMPADSTDLANDMEKTERGTEK